MTAEEILNQLDRCAADFTFPMLDNGYVALADVRMSIYRDAQNWLMIIEVLGYNARAGDFGAFNSSLHLFGSDLHRPPGTANEDFLFPIDGSPDFPFFIEDSENIHPTVKSVLVRGRPVLLDLSPATLKRKGITLLEPPDIDGKALLRSLLPEHRSELLASEAELALRNPRNLPLWLRLDEWAHPDMCGGEMPSESETFRMLADAIVSGDQSRYRPTIPPNTHWSNWPAGGTL